MPEPPTRVDVLTIGHLSRNKFWGEPDDRAVRSALCTSALVRAGGATILVDPGDPPERTAAVLDERAGLRVADVDVVFVTHFHGDHRVGLAAFPSVPWLMAAGELAGWIEHAKAGDRELTARFTAAPDHLAPGVTLLPTPGHTPGHTSLLVRSDADVVIAGDAVPTRDFFLARDTFHNTLDRAAAVAAMDRIAAFGGIIVPGHDNAFAAPSLAD
ncbi:MAG: MBL fold metallo-hydrolase [Mycobacteriales bacterium]